MSNKRNYKKSYARIESIMKPITIFVVKPHPPEEVLLHKSPVPEIYRYDWEPISLKYISLELQNYFKDQIYIDIWHLMDHRDDYDFLKQVERYQPDIVAFSEIDILVNEVSRLAGAVKKISSNICTVVGGKHTSLLKRGDVFPFEWIDLAVQGDGASALKEIINYRLAGMKVCDFNGLIILDKNNKVVESEKKPRKVDICHIDGVSLRSNPVANHSLRDYIETRHIFPAILRGDIRSVPILTGIGCNYNCYFCQAPVERMQKGSGEVHRKRDQVVEEILWLKQNYEANNFFSLESNLNLHNLSAIYQLLEEQGITYLSMSGHIRAADIVASYKNGMLPELARRGLRVLSVGIDIPIGGADIYNKTYTYKDVTDCLSICEHLGIVVVATVFGNPDMGKEAFKKQLHTIQRLPAASFDIRLAIALRNTRYFNFVEDKLIYHPELDRKYFDRQNYRYQTIQYPGKITPENTYDLIAKFYETYMNSKEHLSYVNRFIRKHPDTESFFKRQYNHLLRSEIS